MATGTQSYYLYDPSRPLAGAVAAVYGICFILTLYYILRNRAWVWMVMLLGIGMEVVGYLARVSSAGKPTAKGPFVLQFCLIILAPVLMAGVIYVVFSRIVFWVVPPESRTLRLLWVPPRFITLIFVGFDVVALLLQLTAAVLISGADPTDPSAKDKTDLGKYLGLTGVTIQIVGFGLFTVAAVRFHFVSKRLSGHFAEMNQAKYGMRRDWSKLLLTVNVSCALILIRSVFREIEFAQGKEGVTQQEEWYLYAFDTVPILLVVISYNIWFPGNYLKHLGFRLPKEYRPVLPGAEAGAIHLMVSRQRSSN